MSHLRETRRVSAVSGTVVTMTVPAKTLTRSPTCDSDTCRPPAMSGSSPVGRNSLVLLTKTAPAITRSRSSGKRVEVCCSISRKA